MPYTQAELERAERVIARARAPKRATEATEHVCPRCGGAGWLPDDKATGKRMRAMREAKGLSGREVARRMGMSAPYICDLELGKRFWNTKVTERYLKAIR